jgi:hypothetical protein
MKTKLWLIITIIGVLSAGVRAQSIDSIAPVIIKTVPEAGTTNVSTGEYEIKITFSKKMTDGSWSWASAWKNSAPQSLDKPHYEADGKTCVLKVKLEPGKTYGWWINSQNFHGFRDTQGHPAIPYLFVFQTAAP